MGIFSDARKLAKMGREMGKNRDMGATMAAAQNSMAQASQFMAASTIVATTPAQDSQRLRTTATVTSAQQAPLMVGMNAVVELELIVNLPGGLPLPVRRTEQLAPLHLTRVVPGAALSVSIVPGMPETTRIEWA